MSNAFGGPSSGRLSGEPLSWGICQNNQHVQAAYISGLFIACKGYLYRPTLSRRLIASRLCDLESYFAPRAML